VDEDFMITNACLDPSSKDGEVRRHRPTVRPTDRQTEREREREREREEERETVCFLVDF
jgi:hypothetical protein